MRVDQLELANGWYAEHTISKLNSIPDIGGFSIFFSVSIRAFMLRGEVDYQLTERRIKFKTRIE